MFNNLAYSGDVEHRFRFSIMFLLDNAYTAIIRQRQLGRVEITALRAIGYVAAFANAVFRVRLDSVRLPVSFNHQRTCGMRFFIVPFNSP